MDVKAEVEGQLQVFGANVRRVAEELGLSLSDVAQKAGIPRARLHLMLSATGNPTLTSMCKVALALGVSLVELLSED